MTQDAAKAALQRLLLDWKTIWRSELQALAEDGEAHDAVEAAVRAGAFHSARASAAGADAPSRPATIAAEPDARDGTIERLERRVAELERRLAGHPDRDD